MSAKELQRLLARTARGIEASAGYRRSLAQLLERDVQFKRGLAVEQRQSWLAFEEVLLEHNARLNEAYFAAGYELGRARHSAPPSSRAARLERDVIAALGRVLTKLAQRWNG